MDFVDEFEQAVERKRFYGAYTAQVTDIRDPDGQGRVKVKLPWSPDNGGAGYEVWARLSVLMAGANRGTWFIPDPNDEVLVVFEGGDPRLPRVIGGLWNGSDTPPESMDGAGNNFKKTILSRNGIRITLDDTDGQETLTLQTPAGQTVTMKDGPGSVQVQDSNGNSLTMDTGGVTIFTRSKLTIQASTIEVNAVMVTVNSGMSNFNGVVQSETCISNSVVGLSYTPGVGNLL